MNFFQQISTLRVESLEIKIVNKKNTLSVSILPKSNSKTMETLKPIVITGFPEELDKEFFNIVSSPVQKTVFLISNIVEYEKSLEAVKAEKEEKKKAESKKKETAKTEKYTDKVVEKPKEKPAPPSPYKKYEDAILEIVSVENFKIFRSNRTTLKDAVDKLDDISEGSNVKVGVNLKGNRYTNAKGEEVNTVSLVGWFINATDGASTPNAHDSFGHEKKNKAKAKTKDFSPFDDEEDQYSLPL